MKKAVAASKKKEVTRANNNVIFKIIEGIKYELPVFIFLLFFFNQNRSNLATSDVYVTTLIFDYRIGFSSRLFIGSVMSLFTDYKSVDFMNRFMDIFCIILLFVLSVSAGRIIRSFDGKAREVPIFFVILFLAVPYTRMALYPGPIVSLDRFLIFFTLLSLIVLNKPVLRWFVPVFIFMGLATYHGFAFTYMPAIAILLIFELLHEKKSKEKTALCFVAFITMAVFSAYFFLSHGLAGFNNVDELLAFAADKTDLGNQLKGFDLRKVLDSYFFIKPEDFFQLIVEEGWKGLKSEFIGVLYLMPLFIIFFLVWKGSIKNSSNKAEKFVFTLCMLAPLARLPMFLFSTNFLRGRTSVVIVQFFLVCYMLYVKNETVTAAAMQVAMFFRRHILAFALLLVYFIGFVRLQ